LEPAYYFKDYGNGKKYQEQLREKWKQQNKEDYFQ
jgi:hypothetical protein